MEIFIHWVPEAIKRFRANENTQDLKKRNYRLENKREKPQNETISKRKRKILLQFKEKMYLG